MRYSPLSSILTANLTSYKLIGYLYISPAIHRYDGIPLEGARFHSAY